MEISTMVFSSELPDVQITITFMIQPNVSKCSNTSYLSCRPGEGTFPKVSSFLMPFVKWSCVLSGPAMCLPSINFPPLLENKILFTQTLEWRGLLDLSSTQGKSSPRTSQECVPVCELRSALHLEGRTSYSTCLVVFSSLAT